METRIRGSRSAERVFAPQSIDEFFSGFFERAILHVARNDPGYFADVYSVAELEGSLATGSREADKFALVKAGGIELDPADYTTVRKSVRARATGRPPVPNVDPRKVVARFKEGYTLVIKDAGLFSSRLQSFCTALQRDLESYAQANVYFTPPGSQGFDVHHDTHDTLTIQIDGRKTWRIYEPIVPLPWESQPFPSATGAGALQLHREVVLQAGDTLYIPRGFPHEGLTAQERSLHVTFALMPVRIVDLLDLLVRLAADANVDVRRALARGWADDPKFAGRVTESVLPALAVTCTPELVAFAREILINDSFGLARNTAGGAFDETRQLDAIPDDAVIRIRDDVPFSIRTRGDTVDVVAPSRSLGFPTFCRGALEQLARGPVRFSEIDPSLALQNRHVLVRTLVLEGVAEIESAGHPPKHTNGRRSL
jgi:hypothetical protein